MSQETATAWEDRRLGWLERGGDRAPLTDAADLRTLQALAAEAARRAAELAANEDASALGDAPRAWAQRAAAAAELLEELAGGQGAALALEAGVRSADASAVQVRPECAAQS